MSRNDRSLPPLRIYALTRHERVSVEMIGHAAQLRGSYNRLTKAAAGRTHPCSLSEAERRAIAKALTAAGVDPPHLAGKPPAERADWWLSPMPAAQLERLRAEPCRPNRRGGPHASDVGRLPTHFTRFSASVVGRGAWDAWKRDTRMPLTTDVLDHFGLKADPFDKLRDASARWSSGALDQVEKQCRTSILAGQYILVVGPSGAGKTVLARSVASKLGDRVVVSRVRAPDKSRISEYSLVAAMVLDFASALGREVVPGGSTELAMRRLMPLLGEARDRGAMCLLIVEEAHAVRAIIKRVLKRLIEESADGFEDRLSVLLIGQSDSSARFGGSGARSLEADLRDINEREWTSRLVVVRIPPLGRSLAPYVEHRFGAVKAEVGRVFADGWPDAVRKCLKADRLVPQAVDRLLSDAMRHAADLQDKKVTADHIFDVGNAQRDEQEIAA